MSSKRYISNNSSWAFPIVTIPQTSDGTTTLSVNYSGKTFSASTYTYNLPKLNMSLSVGRGYDVGTILLNGVDTNQSSLSNYDVTEDLTISFTPAVARELTVGFNVSLSVSDAVVIVTITRSGESYLNNPQFNLYVDNVLTTNKYLTNTISGTSIYYCNYDYNSDVFSINTYPSSSPCITEIGGCQIYVVLSGTDDNGNSFSTTSNTINYTKYSDEIVIDDEPLLY